MNSLDIKNNIVPHSMDQVRQVMMNRSFSTDGHKVEVVYLGHLLSRGAIEEVRTFLEELGEEAEVVLNTPHIMFHDGTPLHVALYFNSGNTGRALFQLLIDHGADFHLDGYGHKPWEHQGSIWIDLLSEEVWGDRIDDEFAPMIQRLSEEFAL